MSLLRYWWTVLMAEIKEPLTRCTRTTESSSCVGFSAPEITALMVGDGCFLSPCDGERSYAVASLPLKLTSSCRFTFALGCGIFFIVAVFVQVSIAPGAALLSMVMSELSIEPNMYIISITLKPKLLFESACNTWTEFLLSVL